MAGAEKIIERIWADAHKQAEAIKKEAEAKAADIRKKAEEEAQALYDKSMVKAKEIAEEYRRRTLTIAQLDGRKSVLAAKEEMIKEAFATALKGLWELDTPSYQGIIRRLLMAAVETGKEEVIISADDEERITPEFIQEVNDQLAAQGLEAELTLSQERRPFRGGFVLKSGGIEVNNSFAALLKQEQEDLEPEVAEILFAEAEESGKGGKP